MSVSGSDYFTGQFPQAAFDLDEITSAVTLQVTVRVFITVVNLRCVTVSPVINVCKLLVLSGH